MKIRFGPAVDSKTGNVEETSLNLQRALDFSNEVVELSFTVLDKIAYSKDIVEIFKKFKYKSIHLPVVKMVDGQKVFLSYPNPELELSLKVIDRIIEEGAPNTVLIHPDQVSDFSWATAKYGRLLAFENMDIKKEFGKTISDMKTVFEKCPDSKWVFDLNHIYTNDNSMALAKVFFEEFKDRLAHYHISGYGGFHDALCLSREDIIIQGLISFDYPIVDEGNLLLKDVLQKEFDYIVDRLN